MLASKTERDSLGGTLFFNFAHYVLRPWPWLLVALASLIVYPELSDIQRAFPHLDPSLVRDDIAYPAMLKFLPVGWMGLMVGGLIAANSSTILTLLNWGASYLVHDFYQRFLRPGASEKHYVFAGRVATVGLFLFSSFLVFYLESAKDTFDMILQVGAGTGLLYLVRWFWWRINAWSEVVAMMSSFGISVLLLFLRHHHVVRFDTHVQLLITVALTTVCWLAAAFYGPETNRQTLIAFYRKVHPFGPGWRPIRIAAGISDAEAAEFARHENMPLALLGWTAGCAAIWSSLFSAGNFLCGRYGYGTALLAVFIVSGVALFGVIRRLWK
jgi:Na+/proline symporter